MCAVAIIEPGGPEVLRVIDRAVRKAGPDEVRIAVKAAAVNPTDIGLREQGADGLEPPWVPGMDAARTVESLGPGVSRLRVDEAVMAAVSPRRPEGGAQAELIVVPAASVVPVPNGMSFPQASTLPMNGLTALLGLDQLALEAGQTLAISGGAGLLASYVAALATGAGVRVIADAKPEDEALVRSFGADDVLPRGTASRPPSVSSFQTASTVSSIPRCSGITRSRRSATAEHSSPYAAGAAASPNAGSGSIRLGSPPCSTGPTGCSSSALSPRRGSSRSAPRPSFHLTKPAGHKKSWRQVAFAAAT